MVLDCTLGVTITKVDYTLDVIITGVDCTLGVIITGLTVAIMSSESHVEIILLIFLIARFECFCS